MAGNCHLVGSVERTEDARSVTRAALPALTAATGETFGHEIAIALDAIDSLTETECKMIESAILNTNCDPAYALAALHIQLMFVVAAPHASNFLGALRAWGANRSIDAKLATILPERVRRAYRPGSMPKRCEWAAFTESLNDHARFIGEEAAARAADHSREAAVCSAVERALRTIADVRARSRREALAALRRLRAAVDEQLPSTASRKLEEAAWDVARRMAHAYVTANTGLVSMADAKRYGFGPDIEPRGGVS